MDDNLKAQIRAAASLLYSHKDVAIICGLKITDIELWKEDSESEYYKAYYAGYYETDVALRNSIKQLALAGSSPAQAMLKKIQSETETREYYERG